MSFLKTIFLGTLIFVASAYSQANSVSDSKCGLNLKNDRELSDFRYIFVPGLLNEIVTYYFTEHRRYLILKGVPSEQIHRINIGSSIDPKDAALIIKKTVRSLPQDREFVFFAHSKGALETLYFLKSDYRNISLKKAILIQGALDGSSLAKLESQPDFPITLKNLSYFVRKTRLMSMLQSAFSSSTVRKNLSGLSLDKDLLRKVIFIESKAKYEKLAFKFTFLGRLYRDFFGSPGDGVLMSSDHIPYEIKDKKDICRAYYEVDHSELVKAAPWQTARILRIRNFLKSVLFGFKGDE